MDRHKEFELLQHMPDNRGTSIRLFLKSDGPMRADDMPGAVARFARHAVHITIENADADTRQCIEEQWQISDRTPLRKHRRIFRPAIGTSLHRHEA